MTALGDFAQAREAYEQSLAIRKILGQPLQILEIQAGLVKLALEEKHLDEVEALNHTIYDYLDTHTTDGFSEPMQVYQTCYEGLEALQDSRAPMLLVKAYQALLAFADQIEDETYRASFLQNIPANQKIREAYSKLA